MASFDLSDLEVMEVGRRYCHRAYRRYGWSRVVLDDARTIGKYLIGNIATIATLTTRFCDAGTVYVSHEPGRGVFINPGLCSLADALASWRINANAGRLKPHMPVPAKSGDEESIQNVVDFLVTCGMFGERVMYDYPSKSDIGGMLELPGWTWGKLAELYALADENYFKEAK